MKAGVTQAGYPSDKVVTIPNSSDNLEFKHDAYAARQFRERGWLDDRPLLVYAGTFGKVNGVDYMVRLASVLHERGSNVRILLSVMALNGTACVAMQRRLVFTKKTCLSKTRYRRGQSPHYLVLQRWHQSGYRLACSEIKFGK